MSTIFKQKSSGKGMQIEGLTLELIVKIRTNYKLDLVDSSSSEKNKLISKGAEIDDEIHFVKFEGFYP